MPSTNAAPSPSASCKKKLLGHWRCTGKKESSTPVLFYGTLHCTYGKRAVRSSYRAEHGLSLVRANARPQAYGA